MNLQKLVVISAGLILSLPSLRGAVVVDQQVGHSGVSFLGVLLAEGGSAGQSFTPESSSVQFVTINTLTSANFNTPVEATLRLGLYAGESRSLGSITSPLEILVRSRMIETPSGEFTIVTHVIDPVTWIFDAPVVLTPGSKYSFHVDHVSGDDLMWTASWESYSGGRALFTNILEGTENELMNFSFSEGNLIPEPEVFLMIPIGLAFLSSRRRRERGGLGQPAA